MSTFQDLVAWIAALDPAVAFLFSLPFLVAAAGLARTWFDDHRQADAPRPPARHPYTRVARR
jgi:hypothetical protein